MHATSTLSSHRWLLPFDPMRPPRKRSFAGESVPARTWSDCEGNAIETERALIREQLLQRFLTWQERHAWRRLPAAERVWATSDLHVEHDENLSFLRSLSGYDEDALIVAGDVCTSLAVLRATLRLLASKFRHVFYVVGNHELWHDAGSDGADSIAKLLACYEIATEAGAHAAPALLGSGVAIVPLQSWYHANFLTGGPVDDLPRGHELRMMDSGCRWPEALGSSSTSAQLARFFARCNDDTLAQARSACGVAEDAPPPKRRRRSAGGRLGEGGGDNGSGDAHPAAAAARRAILSFSHFLPRAELHRTHPSRLANRLGDVEGSMLLGEQARAARPRSCTRARPRPCRTAA